MGKYENRVHIRYGMNPSLSPCKDCPDRRSGCHSADECEKWAEFEAVKQKMHEAKNRGEEAYYFDMAKYNKGRGRRLYNYFKKTGNKP